MKKRKDTVQQPLDPGTGLGLEAADTQIEELADNPVGHADVVDDSQFIAEVGVGQAAPEVLLLSPYEIQAPVEANTRRFQTTRGSIVSLAMSMLEEGQKMPVEVVRLPAAEGGGYQLVDGYRRWQAATMIDEEHLSETPYKLQAIVREYATASDPRRWVSSVIQNAQRADLGPVDQAYSLQRLKEAGLTQAQAARKMGLSAPTASQRLQLLKLPAAMQRRVNCGKVAIEPALLALGQPEGEKRTEAVKALNDPTVTPARRKKPVEKPVEGEVGEVEGDSGQVVKNIRPRTAKKILAELEEYATPADDAKRSKAQTWLLAKFIPWVRNPKRKFQKVMEALEEL